jgi:hypothetical protein
MADEEFVNDQITTDIVNEFFKKTNVCLKDLPWDDFDEFIQGIKQKNESKSDIGKQYTMAEAQFLKIQKELPIKLEFYRNFGGKNMSKADHSKLKQLCYILNGYRTKNFLEDIQYAQIRNNLTLGKDEIVAITTTNTIFGNCIRNMFPDTPAAPQFKLLDNLICNGYVTFSWSAEHSRGLMKLSFR